MKPLRPYQQDAIQAIVDSFNKHERQYIVMPTGSGKTRTFLSYCQKYHNKILVVVPSRILLKQVYEAALSFYTKSEISRKGDNHDEFPAKLHIVIIQSINDNYREFLVKENFDLVIFDEAHRVQASLYRKLTMAFPQYTKMLGVTATPDRADGLFLSEILYFQSYFVSIDQLIEQGFLSDIEGFSINTNIDISDVDDHNGDFSLPQLYKKLSCESRNSIILECLKKELRDRKTIVFCINVQHSIEIASLLQKNGIPSSSIYGTMNEKEKKQLLNKFHKGDISCLTNCQLLTEGFDEPSINGIVIARPTKSRALFLQMIGRGLRIFPDKTNCKIIDLVDSHKSTIGLNNIITDNRYEKITRFKTLKQLRDYIEKTKLEIEKVELKKINMLSFSTFKNLPAVPSMISYLVEKEIYFEEPMTCDEATFLIWHNELKKDFEKWLRSNNVNVKTELLNIESSLEQKAMN